MLEAPVRLVEGVGAKAAEELVSLGIETIGELIRSNSLPSKFTKFQNVAKQKYPH